MKSGRNSTRSMLRCSCASVASLFALAQASPALAERECGPPNEEGVIVCEANEDPYHTISYQGSGDYDINVLLKSGAVVDAQYQKEPSPTVSLGADGDVSFFAEDGTIIRGPALENWMPAVGAYSTGGSVNVRVDEVYGGFLGIEAAGYGNVAVSANYVQALNAIDAHSINGDVTIDAGVAAGVGYLGTGIWGRAHGELNITADTVYGDGDWATAIIGESNTGDVNIDAGIVQGEGFGARGIGAYSAEGDVNINVFHLLSTGAVNGQGVEYSEYNSGIVAGASAGNVNINAGSVFADGDLGAQAIVTSAFFGEININAYYVTATGDWSNAIWSESFGDVSITVGTAGTFGEHSEAIKIITLGNVQVDADRIFNNEANSIGLIILGQTATVNVNRIESSGSAVEISTSGDATVTLGSVTTSDVDSSSAAVNVSSGIGNTSITVGESVVSEADRAIVTNAETGNAAVEVAEGAVLRAKTTAITAGSAAGTRIDIAGTVESENGPVIDITHNGFFVEGAGDIRIASTGTVRGTLAFLGADDVVTNAGRFLTGGESNFGAGNDLFVNNGLIAFRNAADTSIALTGLERLENAGLISLQNYRAGDALSLSGTLHGSTGSNLAIDFDLATGKSDLIEVGDLSGTNELHVYLLGSGTGLELDGVTVLHSAGTETGEELTLAAGSAKRGLISLGLEYDGFGRWLLQSDLSKSAYALAGSAAAVRDFWRSGSEAVSAHLRTTRTDAEGIAIWSQGTTASLDSMSRLSHAQGSRDLQSRGSHKGMQLGAEKRLGAFQVGITGGYGSGQIGLNSSEESRFDILNAGLYASYFSGGLFANAILRADMLDAKHSWDSIDVEDKGRGTSLGLELEAGYRANLGGLWVEPAMRVSFVNVSLPDADAPSGKIRWEDGSALTGEIGLRVGTDEGWSKIPVRPYLSMSLASEFASSDKTVLELASEDISIDAKSRRLFGRVGGGLAYSAGPVDLFGELDANIGDVKGTSGRLGVRIRL